MIEGIRRYALYQESGFPVGVGVFVCVAPRVLLLVLPLSKSLWANETNVSCAGLGCRHGRSCEQTAQPHQSRSGGSRKGAQHSVAQHRTSSSWRSGGLGEPQLVGQRVASVTLCDAALDPSRPAHWRSLRPPDQVHWCGSRLALRVRSMTWLAGHSSKGIVVRAYS